MFKFRKFFILLTISFLSACSKIKHKNYSNVILENNIYSVVANKDSYADKTASEYQEGIKLLNNKKYKKSAEKFANIYYDNPGGNLTPYAELMEAYSYYLSGEYQDCIDILENFIKLHPVHPNVEWAYYLRFNAAFAKIHDIYYDQSDTVNAQQILIETQNKFLNSHYNNELNDKLNIINDYLTAKEMYIGKYYMIAKNDPVAAINRFSTVANTQGPHQAEALYRLSETMLAIGLEHEAIYYANKLLNNFSDSIWAHKTHKSIKPNLKDDT